MLFIVGAGVYARSIAAVVGGQSLSSWPATAINILTASTIPLVARAADLWGRKWFLTVPTAFGFVGSMIVARASSMQMAIAGFVVGGCHSEHNHLSMLSRLRLCRANTGPLLKVPATLPLLSDLSSACLWVGH